MSDFDYKGYLKNNPLLTESKEITEKKCSCGDGPCKCGDVKENEDPVSEDARTDAEQEGYKDGFDDAKDDMKSAMSKMKVSELKAKIKEDIMSLLREKDDEDVEEEDVDVDGDIDVDVDIEASADGETAQPEFADEPGLSQDELDIQNNLKSAYDNAIAIGDEKLANQIANTITFFTRVHVVPRND